MADRCSARYCRGAPSIIVREDNGERKPLCDQHWGEYIDAQYLARVAQLRGDRV